MITIMKNNVHRAIAKSSLLISIILLTGGAIAAALFFSARNETTASLAVVSEADTALPETAGLNITYLASAPRQSELLTGTYDAVVTIQKDGSYDIQTIKNEDLKQMLTELLETGAVSSVAAHAARGTGATILGFLMMFLLMQSSALMALFGEDKEHRQIGRVLNAPVSVTKYLAAHSLFNILYLLLATLGILYLIRLISGADIGFTFWQYSLLIFLVLALGTVFSLFLHALNSKSDNASMTGSALLVITTVLSGSFYSFDKGNDLLGSMIRFLPQKAFLNIVDNMEQGTSLQASASSFIYLAAVILIFGSVAVIKTRKDTIRQ